MGNVEVFNDILNSIKKKTKIPVYERSIENVLLAVSKTDDLWQIFRLSREPMNLVSIIIDELVNKGLVKISGESIILTENGKKVLDELGIDFRLHRCPRCRGKGVIIDGLGEDVVSEFLKIVKNRPEAIVNYDQGYIEPTDTLARVAFMDSYGDLKGRRIIILGDDDLVSVAIGLTKEAKEIAVVEIDDRLTSFIEKKAREYGFEVRIYTRDLREPLPEELLGKFDVFETDPPETIHALKLFVGRGISALRGPKCSGYFGLTLIDASLDKWREFQKILVNEFNVVITDIIRDFNTYVNWPYSEEMSGWKLLPVKARPKKNWFTSSWFRIETLSNSRGFNEPMFIDKLYLDEELGTA